MKIVDLFRSPLISRLILFLLIFCILSGGMGAWIVPQSKLLYPFHFDFYGALGKVFVFGIIAFGIMIRSRYTSLEVSSFKFKDFIFLILGLFCLIPFFLISAQLRSYSGFSDSPVLGSLAHIFLVGSVMLAFFGSFGIGFARQLLREFYRELLLCLALSALFFLAFHYIFLLWPYLSKIVLVVVVWLLSLSFPQVHIVPPLTIVLPQFGVTIAQYCSGIESLFLFSALYFLIGVVDWQVFNKKKFFGMYLPLVIGLFVVNILRVYLIILSGVFISPQIASQLFHTYLGMIFFLVYFIIFWWRAYRWMRE